MGTIGSVLIMTLLTQDLLKTICDRLIEALHPERIYLFGSHAYGAPGKASDLDLLVVVRHSAKRMLDLDREARRAIGSVGVPVDVMVYTREKFDRRASWRANFEHTVRSNGRLIYGE